MYFFRYCSNFRNQGLIISMRSLEPSWRTKSMTTTLKWLCPPNLLTAHQSDKVIDLKVQFVKYVVSRREDPRLMKASRARVKSLNFYQVSFSLPLVIVTEVWCVPLDPCDEQSQSQKGIDVIVSAASQAYQFDPICCICWLRTWLTRSPIENFTRCQIYDSRSAKEVYKLESISRIRFTHLRIISVILRIYL